MTNEPSDIYFFFSYARKDLDPYLKRFFQDLVQAVQRLAGNEGVSFRDLTNMEPGDDWPDELAKALQNSRTLVALYSKWYFSRPYCGKEVQVFMERRRSARSQGSHKIMPVFWLSKAWLSRYRLPPATMSSIHYEDDDFPDEYLEHGLSIMAKNRRKAYTLFVEAFAQRLIRLAEEDPLPPYPGLPNLERIRSAFEEAVLAEPPAELLDGPRLVQFLFLTGSPPEMPDSGPPANNPSQWKPFGPDGPQVLDLIDPTLSRCHVFDGMNAGADLHSALLDVRQRNALPIVMVDYRILTQPAGRIVLVSVLDDGQTDCGILVIYDERAHDGASIQKDLERWLQFGQRNRAKLLEIVGSEKALREALSRILTSLRQKTVEGGEVHRVLEGEGPVDRPLLRGPGRAS